jgi:transposase-like protein
MRSSKDPFRGRQFTAEVILWDRRGSLQFLVYYRDRPRMLVARGMEVDHTTVFRWIQAYAPEINKRLDSHLRSK